MIKTKYEAVHPTAVSEKQFLIKDANNFDKNSQQLSFKIITL